jgi:hypothetical protein
MHIQRVTVCTNPSNTYIKGMQWTLRDPVTKEAKNLTVIGSMSE